MILLALAVALILGAVLGSRGLFRLGRSLKGPWRPGAGMAAVLTLFVGLALLARAEWLFGGLLVAVSLGLTAAASRRGPRPASQPQTSGLSRREAAVLLGVSEAASSVEVEAAHRRLMRRAHPDAGGTAGLAAQINAARDVLMRR